MMDIKTIRLLSGATLLLVLLGVGQALVVTQFPHFQTFDSWAACNYPGVCYEQTCTDLPGGWYNVPLSSTNRTRNWWVIEGMTSSNTNYSTELYPSCDQLLTGPCSDHTGSIGGKYVYAEASGCYGSTFDFYSPTVLYSNSSSKVSFYFFMYGVDMDASQGKANLTLQILVLNATTPQWRSIITYTGQQQQSPTDPWSFHQSTVDSLLPSVPTAAAPIAVQYRIRAVTAGAMGQLRDFWKSDIAIDDVLFTQSGASNETVPYIDPTPTPVPSPAAKPKDATSSGGLAGWEIGTIVGSIVGGLLFLALLLALSVILLLLIISPRRGMQKMRSNSTSSEESSDSPIAPIENNRNSIVM